jgi:hypothetical protein
MDPGDGPAETARQRVGYHGPGPETVQEKIEAVHDLVADEQVAAQVATDLLRRLSVAFKAMPDHHPDYWLTA